MFDPSKLVPGDWVSMKYGFERYDFYVLWNEPSAELLALGKPNWIVGDVVTFEYENLTKNYHAPVFRGHTDRRWWRKFMIGIRDLICPFKLLKS